MMINKRLINMVSGSKKYMAGNVLMQWFSLVANIILMSRVAVLLQRMYERQAGPKDYISTAVIFAVVMTVRCACEKGAANMSCKASCTVKKTLREIIYKKLLSLGTNYGQKMNSSEIVQVSVEGVEQLETYFGAYLPQFFFSMIAPVTLFCVLGTVNMLSAVVLLVCVPLIPVTIAVIQTWAKRLLSKYWGQYTALGDSFLENLQGLTTLKIYRTDEMKHREMNEEAEKFRRITMKVLTMQLNSIAVMDMVTYGGSALGMILAVMQLHEGRVTLAGCIMIILLSADFFIPMRRLGSYFHVAMNGMAACDKIFRLLDLQSDAPKEKTIGADKTIKIQDLSYSYNEHREILHGITMQFTQGKMAAVVGESGCGKSTVAGILAGINKGYSGSVTIGGVELSGIKAESLAQNITLVSHNSYLFKGTVRDNLLMGRPDATDDECIEVLKKVKLYDFLSGENGLDMQLAEKASNLSGGQRQRLALARALLHNTPVYIFDEASSNVDVESEEAIMEQIYELAEQKTVILISHRLANVTGADVIMVMNNGEIAESGTHKELLKKGGVYAVMFDAQARLEAYGKGNM
ncbi:MAG: ABC transporter ATP-binding protein/permease [Bacteroides sp.]